MSKKKVRGPAAQRTLEQIQCSGIARLTNECQYFVPVSYPTLHRHYQAGRLDCFGAPLGVEIEHLQEQYRKGFPELNA
jgi:hypothetical protein